MLSESHQDQSKCEPISLIEAANILESLGNPKRLAIFRLLVKSGTGGLAVGKIQQTLEVAPSTLTHHINHLVQRGLISQTREGRVLRCTANYGIMSTMINFLVAECCQGV